MSKNFRPVNRALGSHPSIGPIPAELLIPFMAAAITSYLGNAFLGLSLIQALFLGMFLFSTWWLVTGGNSFRYVSRFSRWFLPQWYRGARRYSSWTNQHYDRSKTKKH